MSRFDRLSGTGGPVIPKIGIDGVPEVGDMVYTMFGRGTITKVAKGMAHIQNDDGSTTKVQANLCRILKKGAGDGSPPKVTKAKAKAPSAKPGGRRVTLTPASGIDMQATLWVWDNWLPLGAFSLLAGREGIGKSTIAYERASLLTRGELPGDYFGNPKAVIVCATEDSWSRTIVPRLTAHRANLDLVYRVNVETVEGFGGALTLPEDNEGLETAVTEHDVGLVVLDPLLSRLDEKLDTYKDSQVRQALEPLSALADRTGTNVLSLIHVNKGQGRDTLTSIMGQRAFAAVARTVLYVVADPDDSSTKVLGLAKSNLGQDQSSYTYRIEGVTVGFDEKAGKAITTGSIEWTGETDQSPDDILRASEDRAKGRGAVTAAAEAGDWLVEYLTSVGGSAPFADIKREATSVGHNIRTLRRAATRLGVIITSEGFPKTTIWTLDQSVPTAWAPVGTSDLSEAV